MNITQEMEENTVRWAEENIVRLSEYQEQQLFTNELLFGESSLEFGADGGIRVLSIKEMLELRNKPYEFKIHIEDQIADQKIKNGK